MAHETRTLSEQEIATWQSLLDIAHATLSPRVLSPFMEAGGVAAAILTEAGHVYTGVCIDTASSLGMCAERNAMAHMITQGESRIAKLVCVMGDGRVGSPCGACREMLMQMDAHSPAIEILRGTDPWDVVTLGELMPDWWGREQMERHVQALGSE